MSIGTPPETQPDRTRLSWRRTLNGVLAVGGIGAIRLMAQGHTVEAALASIVAVVAMIPMYWRQIILRHTATPATWEPLAVALCMAVLAATVVLTP
jgi:hypothetical protein